MKPNIKIHSLLEINFKTLKDFITDENISEDFMILLHQKDFDNLIIKHIDEYNCSIEFPFYYLGIEIDEDIYSTVRPNSIGVIESEKFNQIF